MDKTTLITLSLVLGLPLIVYGAYILVIELAKKNIDFVELDPDTGVIIKKGGQIANILFRSTKGYYQKDGSWKGGEKQKLGLWDKLTGRVLFGITPFYEVFKFDIMWAVLVPGETDSSGRQKAPSITEKKECGSKGFKKFYTHTVLIHGAEMGPEGNGGVDDSSSTRIDAALLVTIEITNVLDAIYKIEPKAVSFKQADAAIEGAFNDYVKGFHWEAFRKQDKLAQTSRFVTHIKENANRVLQALGVGMQVAIVELKYHDLTASPENEKLAESQTLLAIAENESAANIARAQGEKQAEKIRGEAVAARLGPIRDVVGKDNIAAYANLELVEKTELRVYGDAKTNTTAIVETEKK